MNYRAFIKKQLMGGKMNRVRGYGIGAGSRPQIQLNHYSGGTIVHRPIVGSLLQESNNKSGGRIRKKNYHEPINNVTKKFHSLKFNF